MQGSGLLAIAEQARPPLSTLIQTFWEYRFAYFLSSFLKK